MQGPLCRHRTPQRYCTALECVLLSFTVHTTKPQTCSLSNISPDVSNARTLKNTWPWRKEKKRWVLQPYPSTVCLSKSFGETKENGRQGWGVNAVFSLHAQLLYCPQLASGSADCEGIINKLVRRVDLVKSPMNEFILLCFIVAAINCAKA